MINSDPTTQTQAALQFSLRRIASDLGTVLATVPWSADANQYGRILSAGVFCATDLVAIGICQDEGATIPDEYLPAAADTVAQAFMLALLDLADRMQEGMTI